jgi:hypothetical protein
MVLRDTNDGGLADDEEEDREMTADEAIGVAMEALRFTYGRVTSRLPAASRVQSSPAQDRAHALAVRCAKAEPVLGKLRAENERLHRQLAASRETLKDFADPDHWSQDDEGQWVWYGFYSPFERPAIDLLGKLGNAKDG